MTTLSSLKHQCDWIALEAEETFMGDFQSWMSRLYPAVKAQLHGFVNHFTASAPALAVGVEQRKMLAIAEKYPYLDLAHCIAHTPEGLHVPFLQYINVLGPVVEYLIGVEERVNAYNVYLSMLVTNKDDRFSTKDGAAVYKAMEDTRERLNHDLGSCFQPGSHKAVSSYQDVVERNADWAQIFHSLTNLNNKLNTVNRKHIHQSVELANHYLDNLIEDVKKGEFDKAAPQVAVQLSHGAYQIASELEFLSTGFYRLMALNTGVARTVEEVLKVFK